MSRTSYDPQTDNMTEQPGQAIERRQNQPIEAAVAKLSTEFAALREKVEEKLDDHTKVLELFMRHADSTQEQQRREFLALLQKTEDASQRQHDDNIKQHERIIAVFEKTADNLVGQMKARLDDHESDESARFAAIEDTAKKHGDRIKALEDAPTRAKAGRWDRVALAGGALAIAILTAWLTTAANTIAKPAQAAVNAVLPTGEAPARGEK